MIKFRGNTGAADCFSPNKIVYGDYSECAILGFEKWINTHEANYPVAEVAQLCFVENGVEYYEGDIKVVGGKKFKCKLQPVWEKIE